MSDREMMKRLAFRLQVGPSTPNEQIHNLGKEVFKAMIRKG